MVVCFNCLPADRWHFWAHRQRVQYMRSRNEMESVYPAREGRSTWTEDPRPQMAYSDQCCIPRIRVDCKHGPAPQHDQPSLLYNSSANHDSELVHGVVPPDRTRLGGFYIRISASTGVGTCL